MNATDAPKRDEKTQQPSTRVTVGLERSIPWWEIAGVPEPKPQTTHVSRTKPLAWEFLEKVQAACMKNDCDGSR
jgi:hypothetical protein